MRDPENIEAIAALRPDFLGLIFFPASKRFVGSSFSPQVLDVISSDIRRVGVFVDEDPAQIVACVERFGLHVVQLHGHESVEMIADLRPRLSSSVVIWKAFGIDQDFDFARLSTYEGAVDRFLFDTKVPERGGSGMRFDWSLLMRNPSHLPYMLAGGLDLSALPAAFALQQQDPRLVGIDLNSRLEIAPGRKSVVQVEQVIREVRYGISR
ncbi:MAG: phosphoribosylanthranilate isomerase [Myxococcales bacterium]|nr:phosphoribosylanthranilate isomerase [Myxococcales bacterium]MCB9644281.1 phosphoribosylanthranilate isomerase [Myxococcales bacterium]